MIAIIFGPFWKGLQSYMVRFGTDIAVIFGPLCNADCNHIQSLLSPWLQSYLGSMMRIVAILFCCKLLQNTWFYNMCRNVAALNRNCIIKIKSWSCTINLQKSCRSSALQVFIYNWLANITIKSANKYCLFKCIVPIDLFWYPINSKTL